MYYPQYSEIFKAMLASLAGQQVIVLGHVRPDGDCIGSQVALARVLAQLGIDVVVANADAVPKVLQSFLGDTPVYLPKELSAGSRVAVYVDCADPGRVGADLTQRFEHVEACIDHHISNPGYAHRNIIDPTAAATAQLLAGLFIDHDLPIDAVTAEALYLGILTDTGQFRHGATTPMVFAIAAELVKRGACPERVAHELFERETLSRVHLRQRFLATLKLELRGRVCVGALNQKDFEQTCTSHEDAEGFVDITRAIDGVDIGVYLQQLDSSKIKGSLRTRDPRYRVDQLARLFGGGGHVCAAGFKVDDTLEAFYPRFIGILDQHIQALG